MRGFLRRQSAMRRFLLLDVLLVLAILLCSLPAYGRMLSATEEEVLNRSRLCAHQAAAEVDAAVINLLNTVSSLRLQEDLGKLALHEGDTLPGALFYTLRSAQAQIKSAFFAYDQAAQTLVLFRRNQLLITNRQCFVDRGTYFERFARTEAGATAFEEELTAEFGEMRLLNSRSVCLEGEFEGRQRLPLLLPDGNGESALFCVLLETETLLRGFGGEASGSGSFVILRDEGDRVVASLDAPEDWSTSDQYVCLEQEIPSLGVRALVGVPKAYFSQVLAPQRRLILIYSALLLAAGLALAASIAWRSAQPVQHLVESLRLERTAGESEYSVLERAFHSLDDSCGELRENVSRLEHSLALASLGQLLHSSSLLPGQEESFLRELPRLRGAFRVAAVRVDARQSGEDELLLAQIAQEFSAYAPVYPVNRSMLALLVREEECAALAQQVEQMGERLGALGACLSMGVSGQETDVRALSRAFALAIDRVESASQEGAPFDAVRRVPEESFTFAEARRCWDLLMAGAQEQLEGELAALAQRMFTSRQRKRLYYGWDLMLASAAAEHSLPAEELKLPPYEDALSLQEICARAAQASRLLCAQLQKKREAGNTELKRRVKAYIDGHIDDPELYADTVAQACGLSVKYLHRIFHEYTGKSVCDYIEEERMQRARQMLQAGEGSISQISEQCGFRSLNTFYKAFKRVNGTSPSEWRRRALEQAENPS